MFYLYLKPDGLPAVSTKKQQNPKFVLLQECDSLPEAEAALRKHLASAPRSFALGKPGAGRAFRAGRHEEKL